MAKVPTEEFGDPSLLTKIDGLFACGVGDHVSLPQLIVVGDQSSGKSSVLEGLTSLPFPKDSTLCTRFPTWILFRRTPETSITAGFHRKAAENQEAVIKLKKLTKWTASTFTDVMAEAHDAVGLGAQRVGHNPAGQSAFSNYILKIEICGPDQRHFSVLDVPGLFKKTTEGVTTQQDMEDVRKNTCFLMSNPRTIIVAVIPANVDVATQEILTLAEEYDPEGTRTVGVLTKPDLVDKGAETPVLNLLSGKSHPLKLGWYIVRNLGQRELQQQAKTRNSVEEAFFLSSAPWNSVGKARVGADALKSRLGELLNEHVRRTFPTVRAEIHKLLKAATAELESLGPQRESTEQQRHHLTDVSFQFQDIVRLALSGQYSAHDCFSTHPDLKFATALADRCDVLWSDISAFGHTYDLSNLSGGGWNSIPAAKAQNNRSFTRHSVLPDLDEIFDCQFTCNIKSEKATSDWLSDEVKACRGFELGTFDMGLLSKAMRKQAERWHQISFGFISDVIHMAHTFIAKVLELTCPNVRIRKGILASLKVGVVDRYRKAYEQVKHLLEVELKGTPFTVNHYFNENLEKARQQRLRKTLEPQARQVYLHKGAPTTEAAIRLSDLANTTAMSNVEHMARELGDRLDAYYKVASKRFVDYVCLQCADHPFVVSPDSPLKLFSHSWVLGLTTEQLEEIAGEFAQAKKRRVALQKKTKELKAGAKIVA